MIYHHPFKAFCWFTLSILACVIVAFVREMFAIFEVFEVPEND